MFPVIRSDGGGFRPADLNAAVRDIATDLRRNIPTSVDRGVVRLREEVPTCFGLLDPGAEALIHDSYAAVLGFIYDGLEGGWGPQQREPPELAAEDARMTADRGVDLRVLTHSYRIGQRLLFEEVMEQTNARVGDKDLRLSVLAATNRWLFGYFDWMTTRMVETYEHELRLLARDEEWRKRRLVRDLLESDDELGEVSRLGYDIFGSHVAIVASGAESWRVPLALRELTGAPLLSVSIAQNTTWAWLGVVDGLDPSDQGLDQALRSSDARVAISEHTPGVAGFRISHRQALAAYRVARYTDAHVTWYSDVVLMALTLQDPDAARRFVLSELGPLAADEPRSEVLRETLAAYFGTGHNATSAASALGVHDRTVLYRIRSIEDQLGRQLNARREELALALRLAPLVLDCRGGLPALTP